MQFHDPLTWLFVAVVVLATGLALIAAKGSLSLVPRVGALALAALVMATSYAGLTELMSRPKPVNLEWLRGAASPAKVAASHLRENEAIYLWLVFKGETEPRAYRLPWNMKMAQQLRQAERRAAARKSSVMMKSLRPGRNAPSERVFHVPPRPAPPPKVAQADG